MIYYLHLHIHEIDKLLNILQDNGDRGLVYSHTDMIY